MRIGLRRAPSPRGATIPTILSIALLCASLAYWGLQLAAPRPAIAPSGSLVDLQAAPDLASAAQLFGQAPRPGEVASIASNHDIRVLGVAASTLRGSAVLAIDGGAPRAFLAGDRLNDGLRLLEVRPDAVIVEQHGHRIELPTPQRPDVAILSSGPRAGATPPLPGTLTANPGPAANEPGAVGAAAAAGTSGLPMTAPAIGGRMPGSVNLPSAPIIGNQTGIETLTPMSAPPALPAPPMPLPMTPDPATITGVMPAGQSEPLGPDPALGTGQTFDPNQGVDQDPMQNHAPAQDQFLDQGQQPGQAAVTDQDPFSAQAQFPAQTPGQVDDAAGVPAAVRGRGIRGN